MGVCIVLKKTVRPKDFEKGVSVWRTYTKVVCTETLLFQYKVRKFVQLQQTKTLFTSHNMTLTFFTQSSLQEAELNAYGDRDTAFPLWTASKFLGFLAFKFTSLGKDQSLYKKITYLEQFYCFIRMFLSVQKWCSHQTRKITSRVFCFQGGYQATTSFKLFVGRDVKI